MSTPRERITDFSGARIRNPGEPRPKPIPIAELRRRAKANAKAAPKAPR